MNETTTKRHAVGRLLDRFVSCSLPITKDRLEANGFRYVSLDDDPPYEMWEKHGIEVWDFNHKYWIVQMLDQASVHVQFHTMGDLDKFFTGCGQDMYS